MAKDIYHNQVKNALTNEGWEITHDPLTVQFGGIESKIDLGAEKVIGAQKNGQKIAVEIKSFIRDSTIYEFHHCLPPTEGDYCKMAELETYRTYIKKVITDYANFPTLDDIERQLIFDTEHDHYQLVNVGWRNDRRIHGCILHIDLKDGKIWIQYNGTEIDLADQFVALGVPKQDIVLGLHSPFKRQFTEFAVC